MADDFRRVRCVGERDIVEDNVFIKRFRLGGRFGEVFQLRIRVEQLEYPFASGGGFLKMRIQFREFFNWFVGLLGGVADDGERRERDFVMVADDQEDGGQGDGDKLHGGLHEDVRQHGAFDGTEIAVGLLRELLAFIFFCVEGFYNADSGKVLRHFRDEHGNALQDFPLVAADVGGQPKDGQDADRHGDDEPHGLLQEIDGDGFLDDELKRDKNENRRCAQFGSGNRNRVFNNGCVVRAKRYETSDIVFGKERHGLLLELVEQLDADIRDGARRNPSDEIFVDEFAQRLQEEEGEHQADEHAKQRE